MTIERAFELFQRNLKKAIQENYGTTLDPKKVQMTCYNTPSYLYNQLGGEEKRGGNYTWKVFEGMTFFCE